MKNEERVTSQFYVLRSAFCVPRRIDLVRSRLTLLAALLFSALPAFAHGPYEILYAFIAAGIIVPIIFIIRAAWFNGRGTAIVFVASALIAFGLMQVNSMSGCLNFLLMAAGPSIATFFVSAVAYQFDSLRK